MLLFKKQRQAKPLVAWQQEFDDVQREADTLKDVAAKGGLLTRALVETLRQQMSSVNDLMLKIPGYKHHPARNQTYGLSHEIGTLKAQAESQKDKDIFPLNQVDAKAEFLTIDSMAGALNDPLYNRWDENYKLREIIVPGAYRKIVALPKDVQESYPGHIDPSVWLAKNKALVWVSDHWEPAKYPPEASPVEVKAYIRVAGEYKPADGKGRPMRVSRVYQMEFPSNSIVS